MAIEWVSVNSRLPDDYQVVLVHTNRTNVIGRGGAIMNIHVVQFVRGSKHPMRGIGPEDVGFNNKRPFYWDGDGPCSWFGQDVTYWAPLTLPTAREGE